MVRRVGEATAVVLLALSALHAYWGCGGRAGFASALPEVGGRRTLDPGPLACFVVAALLAVAATLVLARAGAGIGRWLPSWAATVGTAGVAAAFALRAVGNFRAIGFAKGVRGTRFATLDDFVYSPLCVALALACALVAARGRGSPPVAAPPPAVER